MRCCPMFAGDWNGKTGMIKGIPINSSSIGNEGMEEDNQQGFMLSGGKLLPMVQTKWCISQKNAS